MDNKILEQNKQSWDNMADSWFGSTALPVYGCHVPTENEFNLKPICVYSVIEKDNFDGQETFGMLYFAEIKALQQELHSEIEKIVLSEQLPDHWTYPTIQPILMEEAKKRGII